ncbi:MAG: ATP-binding protein [Acidimicrobiales bacterium]
MPGLDDSVELELPARPEYLAVVRSVVTEVAEAASSLPAARIDDLRLAVTEACANAIDATRRSSGSHINLRCELDGAGVVVEVHDAAGGFDPDALVPHPPVTKPDRLKFERGLGVPLMRALADEVTFRQERGGTTVRLVVGVGSRPRERGTL